MASVPAFQAGYTGSIPVTRTRIPITMRYETKNILARFTL